MTHKQPGPTARPALRRRQHVREARTLLERSPLSAPQARPASVTRHLELLPGVPLIASPFFADIVASDYFDDGERQIAAALHHQGYAVLDFPDPDLVGRARRIAAALSPLFAAARHGGERFDGRLQPPRFHDAFHLNEDVAALATNATLLSLLSKLYGRPAFPFQTLNFERGSQQHFHTDAVHFHSWPADFMCGVWVALEEVTPDNGPLCYYPGSHRWAGYASDHITARRSDLSKPASQAVYLSLWRELVAAYGCAKERFLAKRGQALIWTASLLHGGEPILDRTQTRWSQVTHYFFENCAYYSPMASHVMAGQIAFLEPLDVRTRRPVQSAYAERPIPQDHLVSSRHRWLLSPEENSASRLPHDFDSARYLVLHPDVAEAGVDPAHHYLTHGRFEGRAYK